MSICLSDYRKAIRQTDDIRASDAIIIRPHVNGSVRSPQIVRVPRLEIDRIYLTHVSPQLVLYSTDCINYHPSNSNSLIIAPSIHPLLPGEPTQQLLDRDPARDYKTPVPMAPSHSSSSSSIARDRLQSLSSQIMSPNPSVFTSSVVAAAPEDPLFGLAQAYRQDPSDKKIDLVIGAYRDDHAKPWILPVVKKVSVSISDSAVTRDMFGLIIYRPTSKCATIPVSTMST